ncbi:MAG: hypothetical protein ACE5EI_06360 [Thermodesulfobacteriota bacterium]
MADNRLNIIIGVQDEYSKGLETFSDSVDRSVSRARQRFEELDSAQKEAGLGVDKLKKQYEELGSSAKLRGSLEGAGGAGAVLDRKFLPGAKALNADFTALAEKNIPATKAEEDALGSGAIPAAPEENVEVIGQQEKHQALLDEKQRFITADQALTERHAKDLIELDKRKWATFLDNAGQSAGTMSNMMQNLFVATGSKHRAMFETMKAFAIAETIIQTFRAAQGAYAAMAKINPALGIAAAAAATAAGLARVRLISDTKPAGATATISAEGTANPPFEGGSFSAQPVPQRFEKESLPTQHITIQIYSPLSEQNWEKIVEDNIAPALMDLKDRNVEISFNV